METLQNQYYDKYSSLRKIFPFPSRYFNLKSGHYMHYIDVGESQDKPTLLFVHGNPSWSFLFRNTILELQKTHRCIAIDHLGFGLSEKPADEEVFTPKRHAQNLCEFIDYLQLDQICLVVHDWGGPIGIHTLLHYDLQKTVDLTQKSKQTKFSHLVISNTAAFNSKDIPWRIRLCRVPWLNHYLVGKFNLFSRAALTMTTKRSLYPFEKYWYWYPHKTPAARKGVELFVRDIPLQNGDKHYDFMQSIENGLSKVHIPVMLLWGGDDFCFHRKFYQRFCEYFPRSQKEFFPDAGHYVWEDKTQECIEKIRVFLTK